MVIVIRNFSLKNDSSKVLDDEEYSNVLLWVFNQEDGGKEKKIRTQRKEAMMIYCELWFLTLLKNLSVRVEIWVEELYSWKILDIRSVWRA